MPQDYEQARLRLALGRSRAFAEWSCGILRHLTEFVSSANPQQIPDTHNFSRASESEFSMKCVFSIFVLVCINSSVTADFINGNFESPSIPNGSFTTGLPEWSQSGSNDSGVWNIFPGNPFFSAEAPEGTQIGYSNNLSMAQQSSKLLTQDTVTLYAFAGRREDGFAGSFRMELWAGGTVSQGSLTGATLLSSVDFDHTSFPPNSFQIIETSYTPSVGDPLIGQLLSARFVLTAGFQMNMDGVGFSPIPEPSTFAIFLLAGLLGSCRRVRKEY